MSLAYLVGMFFRSLRLKTEKECAAEKPQASADAAKLGFQAVSIVW
jgi:hypothetical protein